jgi:hypothetical protein
MRGLLFIGLVLPVLGWAQTDAPPDSGVPAAPTPVQRALLDACLNDMPHRVGPFQNHGDLACSCMFTGPTAWNPGGDPAQAEAKSRLLADSILAGSMSLDLRYGALRNGIGKSDVDRIELLARVYPAVFFENKAVVQCFNAKCRETTGCEVEMNDVSGSAPQAH